MVQRPLQLCCRRTSPSDSIKNHIWISEDILTTQWLKFISSRKVHTVRSRTASVRPQAQQKHNDPTSKTCLIENNSPIYRTQRHGSATPGPLEARRRRAARKHMTGAANLGIFGDDLGSSRSKWNYNFDQAEEVVKSRCREVAKRGNSVLEALGMISRWNMLDVKAVAEARESAVALQRRHVKTDPFAELVQSMDVEWTKQPENIVTLIHDLLETTRTNQEKLIQSACNWIRAEVSLGSMPEFTMKEICWNMSQESTLVADSSINPGSMWRMMICQNIGHGIVVSTTRKASDLQKDTVWILLRSLATGAALDPSNIHILSRIVHSIAMKDVEEAVSLLQAYLETALLNIGPDMKRIGSLLQNIPVGIVNAAVIGLCQSTIRASKHAKVPRGLGKAPTRLESLLEALPGDGSLSAYWKNSAYHAQWLKNEHDIFNFGAATSAKYLHSANQSVASTFIINHILGASGLKRTADHERSIATRVLETFEGLAQDQQTYESLLCVIGKQMPTKLRPTLHFMLEILRNRNQPAEYYKVLTHIFSSGAPRGARTTLEFWNHELKLWSRKDPIFALQLAAIDPRPEYRRSPIIMQILGRMNAQLHCLPPQLAVKLSDLLIGSQKECKSEGISQEMATKSSETLLQMVLQMLDVAELQGNIAFRRSKRILRLLSDRLVLEQETSVAITNIVAIKALESRRRIPIWHMNLLAEVITHLEGHQVWEEAKVQIDRWWSSIEREEHSQGRAWLPHVGWIDL